MSAPGTPAGSDAPRSRSLVVLAMNEAAAARVAAQLERGLRQASSEPSRFRRVRRVEAPPRGLALRWADRFGAPEVLVGRTDPGGWAQLAHDRPDLYRLAYVRPGLMPLRDVIRPPGERSPGEGRWEDLVASDLLLKGSAVLSEEELFAGGPELAGRLAAWLDVPAPTGSPTAPPDPEGYVRAIDETAGGTPSSGGAPTWAPSGVFSVRTGGEGLPLLGSGWSHGERDRVWSDAERLTLRLPPVPPGRILLCRLVGEVARLGDGAVRVRAVSEGARLGEVARGPDAPPGFALDLRIPGRPDGGAPLVELEVEGAVRASDTRPGGDERLLGFALMRLELRDGGALAADGAGGSDPLWARLVRRRRPRTALVLGREADAVDEAAGALAALGCADVRTAAPTDGAALAELLARLAGAAARADLVVLCDPAAARDWFAALPHPPAPLVAGSADLILAGGDPSLWPEGLLDYAQAWSALIEVSDRSTTVETWAAP